MGKLPFEVNLLNNLKPFWEYKIDSLSYILLVTFNSKQIFAADVFNFGHIQEVWMWMKVETNI